MMQYGLKADMIYIDASHEVEDVYQDLLDFHQIVKEGGIIFGDDWSWSGVRAALERFTNEEKLVISHLHDKWILRKR